LLVDDCENGEIFLLLKQLSHRVTGAWLGANAVQQRFWRQGGGLIVLVQGFLMACIIAYCMDGCLWQPFCLAVV